MQGGGVVWVHLGRSGGSWGSWASAPWPRRPLARFTPPTGLPSTHPPATQDTQLGQMRGVHQLAATASVQFGGGLQVQALASLGGERRRPARYHPPAGGAPCQGAGVQVGGGSKSRRWRCWEQAAASCEPSSTGWRCFVGRGRRPARRHPGQPGCGPRCVANVAGAPCRGIRPSAQPYIVRRPPTQSLVWGFCLLLG